MKNGILALAGFALTVSGFAAAPAYAAPTAAEKGQARLAKMIEGRVAGTPVKCVSAMNGNKIEVIDETAVIYDAGKTIYVARPINPRMLDKQDVLVTKRTGSQFCVNDSMRIVDRVNGFTTSVVFLEDFVPYTKEG